MIISREEVLHMARVFRMSLSESEIELIRKQLVNILDQFAILKEVDTSNVSDSIDLMSLEGVMRDDIPSASSPENETLQNAPRKEGQFFRVKAVLEE